MPKKSMKKRRGTSSGINSVINDAAKEGKLIIGSNIVIKGLKKGNVKSVIIATNIPENKKTEVDHHASVSGTSIETFEGDSSKLGETCGKPFNILLVGIMK